jgi:polar amino acid transport system substrate-binding protein
MSVRSYSLLRLGMRRRSVATIAVAMCLAVGAPAQSPPAPIEGTVRVAYLASNPAHATRDPATGEARGVVIDLAHELGRQRGVAVSLLGLENPQRVIDAVRNGEADIGFVAYNPERAGPVEFSKPYLLVQQTFLVGATSPISAVAELDRPGTKLGATRGDSIALYLRRTLQQATLVELASPSAAEILGALREGTIDAFGANRQRLTDLLRGAGGVRLLPDDLYGVEQTIIVPAGRHDALEAMNRFIDETTRSGFLAASIQRSGVIGITPAESR